MGRKREEDEKDLLFFISDEYEDETDEDTRVVDPCHQTLLSLLDKLLFATAVFISLVLLFTITILVYGAGSKSNPHLLDIALKSNALPLPLTESMYMTNEIFVQQNPFEAKENFRWDSLQLCNNIQRRSVLSYFMGNITHFYPTVDKQLLDKVYASFLKTLYRNTSDVVSPLDQINNCDINNRFQPKIKTIIPSDVVIKMFPPQKKYDDENIETAFKLLASQYDEEDAIISIDQFPHDDDLSSLLHCNRSTNMEAHHHRHYISDLRRICPANMNNFNNSCITLTIKSSSFSDASNKIIDSPKKGKKDKVFSFSKGPETFNARFILNSEAYDQDSINSYTDDPPLKKMSFDLRMVALRKNSNANHRYLMNSVKVLPGYNTNVVLEGCVTYKENNASHTDQQFLNSTLQVSQVVEITPWRLSSKETMLAFGRVGYRLQNICTFKGLPSKQRSLEEKYPNICKEISTIEFKSSGESNVAAEVFGSEEEKVAPGTNAILAYIRDNIAILNIQANFKVDEPCKNNN